MWSRGVDKSGRAVLVVVCLASMLAIAGTDCQAQWSDHSDGTYNYWALNSVDKFRWEIATHQWCHWSTQGGTWKTLSTPGIDWSNIYDGAWRAMGYGLTYRYDQANNYGFFAGNTSYRFHYRYGPGQWYTSGCGGGWYKIGSAGSSADVLGDGNTYDLGGGVRFRYAASTDFGFYYNNFAYRFYYRYNPGQWYTSGYNGGWYTIGAAGTCANVLSDGGWYNLGNGTWFRYNAASDYGFYGGDGYRFYYRYTSGQWYTSGVGGGWTILGNAGRTAVSLFDGVFQDLGNGWSFGYQGSLDLGTYVSNIGTCNFSYDYALGQWAHKGFVGGWGNLGYSSSSVSFVGDGARHGATNGWLYSYDYGGDIGKFFYDDSDTALRFSYAYDTGIWSHHDNGGGQGVLSGELALSDVSFIGEGWNQASAGPWYYFYDYGANTGLWARQSGGSQQRFSYDYVLQQWAHYGDDGGAADLGGPTSLSIVTFMGDENRHATPFTNSWWYSYNYGSDRGQFFNANDDAGLRFSYLYQTGVWGHHDANEGEGVLSESLSLTNVPMIGEGFNQVSATPFWYYDYDYGADTGYWELEFAGPRFSYDYVARQWTHYGDDGGAAGLGSPTSLSSVAFMGDEGRHQILSGWWYSYNYGSDRGQYFTDNSDSALRFSYGYVPGTWNHHDASGGEGVLSDYLSLSVVSFIGQGRNQVSTNPWYYSYNYGTDEGFWARQSDGLQQRFSYDYLTRTWGHYDDLGGQAELGGPTSLTDVTFMGDGSRHQVLWVDNWWYSYNGSDRGQFFNFNSDAWLRFSFAYETGVWNHHDLGGGEGVLSEALSLTEVPFIGSGWNQVSAGPWYYFYDYENELGLWARQPDGSQQRFSFSYWILVWDHYDGLGGQTGLGVPTSLSGLSFIGDEARHEISTDWRYSYNYGSDRAQYFYDDSDTAFRFSYAYQTGVWGHHDAGGGWGAFTKPLSLSDTPFIGAEGVYTEISTTSVPWYYTYNYGEETGYWAHGSDGSLQRFSYDYANLQWRHYDGLGGSTDLGIPTSLTETTFMGDGTWHNISSGLPPDPQWYYVYAYYTDPNEQRGVWSRVPGPDDLRFAYFYNQGYWAHIGLNGVGSWFTNPPTAISLSVLAFMGDGDPHGGTAYWYSYNYGLDRGEWARADTLSLRFTYAYETGIWSHHDVDGGEGELTGPVTLQQVPFIGVGWNQVAAIGPWYYGYNWDADTGFWARVSDGTQMRFSYKYDSGEWRHYDWTGTSGVLASTGGLALAPYDGSGGPKQVSSAPDWWYVYLYEWDAGHWARNEAGTPFRFAYYYDSGNWFHHDDSGGFDLLALSVPLSTVTFMGIGGPHPCDANWLYQYDYGLDTASWFMNKTGTPLRFSYDYQLGQWYHYGWGDGVAPLGPASTGLTMDGFPGNSQPHQISDTPIWWYWFSWGEDRGYFSLSADAADKRFSYKYDIGMWMHYGWENSGYWISSSQSSLSEIAFIGSGDRESKSLVWWYRYYYDQDTGEYYNDDADAALRFTYAYDTGQWRHHAPNGGVATLGDPMVLSVACPFIGNGSRYQIATGWWYAYNYTDDWGQYFEANSDTALRFSYGYVNSKWSHWDYDGAFLWSGEFTEPLSLTDVPFIGESGEWTQIVYSAFTPWYYTYDNSAHVGYWSLDDLGGRTRFSYDYLNRQWAHYDDGLGSAPIGAATDLNVVSFIGDGALHADNVDTNMWWYRYGDGADRGFWSRTGNGSQQRFFYEYTSGQWGHIAGDYGYLGEALLGDTTDLSTIRFIGLFTAQQIVFGGQPWWYGYDYGQDGGGWSQVDPDTIAEMRFGYNYTYGTWGHKAFGAPTMTVLGAATGSRLDEFDSFAGDGSWGKVNTGPDWHYRYDYGRDTGFWALADEGADQRFSYQYSGGQWLHFGADDGSGAWKEVGNPGYSAEFIGDGAWHSLGTWYGYQWAFNYNADQGEFARYVSGTILPDGYYYRFAYNYADQQWSHYGADDGSGPWKEIGNTGYSAAFIGDGAGHDLGTWWGNTWQYTYSGDQGVFARDVSGSGDWNNRFAYHYVYQLWSHFGADAGSGPWYAFTYPGYTAAFMGDNQPHYVGNISGADWRFTYNGDQGEFARWVTDNWYNRFAYDYVGQQWSHFGADGWKQLGASANAYTSAFIGDSNLRYLGVWYNADWSFTYNISEDRGEFARWITDNWYNRFAYDYVDQQWSHFGHDDGSGPWKPVGNPGFSGAFIGRDDAILPLGVWHGLSWGFFYMPGTDQGYFAREIFSGAWNGRFYYKYADKQWYHAGGSWLPLGDPGNDYSAEFIGDCATHNLGTWYGRNWRFTYDAADFGKFSTGSDTAWRFAWAYSNGVWYFWERGYTWTALSRPGASANVAFIGDGQLQDVYGGGATWRIQLVSADRMEIVNNYNPTGNRWLAYNFADSYWMDGASGYSLAQITGGSSPFWFDWSSTNSNGYNGPWLSASNNMRMRIAYFTDGTSAVYYFPSGSGQATWYYLPNTATWYEYVGGSWINRGTGSPELHRQ